MKTLRLLPIVALAIMASLNALAGTPKVDANATKGETKSETSTESKTKSGDTYYWFNTNAAGTALLDASGIPLDQEASETGPCDAPSGDFCARGYTAAQTSISGGKRVINVAVTASVQEAHVEE